MLGLILQPKIKGTRGLIRKMLTEERNYLRYARKKAFVAHRLSLAQLSSLLALPCGARVSTLCSIHSIHSFLLHLMCVTS